MTALIQTLFYQSKTEGKSDDLSIVIMFCCAGLLVSMLLASYGFDLGVGVF